MSVPAEPLERWRVGMQSLYDGMKRSIADPLIIDGQYYDTHDDLSDFINRDFNATQAEVIVGIRKLAFADFIPSFLDAHQKFFDLVQRLAPETNPKDTEERRTAASGAYESIETYKKLIDSINKVKERIRDISSDYGNIIINIPNEFGLHSILKRNLKRDIDCFNYPRCKSSTTEDYASSLGDYHILKDIAETVKAKDFLFIPNDDQYLEDCYPGGLGSYKARIRFTRETLEKLDLVKLREARILDIIRNN